MPTSTGRRAKPRPEAADGRPRAVLRAGLVLLAVVQVGPALWASLFPRSFYSSFPVPALPWVSLFPPYNEHLVRDVGEGSLQILPVTVFAAVCLDRRLVRWVLLGWLLWSVPHLVFHVVHLPPVNSPAAQVANLAAPVALTVALMWLNERDAGGREAGPA